MNHTKTDPKGIDAEIQKLQTYMYNRVIAKWGLTSDNFDMYGRVYRERNKGGYIPMAYVGGKDYKEVFLDDTKALIMFFDVGDAITSADTKKGAQLSIYCFGNLSFIPAYASTTERMDEEARNDIETWVDRNYDFFLSNTVIGNKAILDKYSGMIKDKANDRGMHPYITFRLDGQLSNYYITFNNI